MLHACYSSKAHASTSSTHPHARVHARARAQADPLIDGAYKGTKCMVERVSDGLPFRRRLKDFNALQHRPYLFTRVRAGEAHPRELVGAEWARIGQDMDEWAAGRQLLPQALSQRQVPVPAGAHFDCAQGWPC